MHAPPDHGLAQQQRRSSHGLAGGYLESLFACARIAAAAEGDRLDSNGRHAMLGRLDGEVVLVAVFIGAVAALVVNADDVVDAAAVAGHADYGSVRWLGARRRQEIAQQMQAGRTFEKELLAPVARKFAHFESLRVERWKRYGERSQQLDQLGVKLLLPCLGLLP